MANPNRDDTLSRVGLLRVFTDRLQQLTLDDDMRERWLQIKSINHSQFGSFVDYLCRRLIAELNGYDTYEDVRANDHTQVLQCEARVRTAYHKYMDMSLRSEDILDSIFLTSWCHTMMFEGVDVPSAECMLGRLDGITPRDIQSLREALISVQRGTEHLVLNPVLSYGIMGADADMWTGDYMVDFKTNKTSGHETTDLLTLFAYAALAGVNYPDDPRITHVQIFNPVMGYTRTCDISDWSDDDRKRFVELLVIDDRVFVVPSNKVANISRTMYSNDSRV